MALTRDQIAQRIALELKNGDYVNLGIGIPTRVANHIPPGIEILLQSENGLLGLGGYPHRDAVDVDLINAGKESVTAVTGASTFDSAQSFAMIRGGHIDLTVLGAFEVDQSGNLASWMIPNKMVKGMGGAMDLAAGAKRVIVAMQHTSRDGRSKLLSACRLPLTGVNCVQMVVTDLAVLTVKANAFHLEETAPGVSIAQVQAATEGDLVIGPSVTVMQFAG